MKDFKVTLIGVIAIIITLALNFRHALNNYGVLNNGLHMEVLAQSNNSGGSSNGGGSGNGSNNNGGSNQYYYEHLLGRPKNCTLYKGVNTNGTVTYSSSSTSFGGGWTVSQVKGTVENCPNNGNGCTVYSCHVTSNTGGNT